VVDDGERELKDEPKQKLENSETLQLFQQPSPHEMVQIKSHTNGES
jgi:hypothetical protein